MEYYLYILKSISDGKRYIGIARDVNRRLKEHNSGYVTSTKARRPFVHLYTEKCADRPTARKREKYFKSAAGRRMLNRLEMNKFGPLAQLVRAADS